MTYMKLAAVHPAAEMYAAEVRAGLLSRREFLARSTALDHDARRRVAVAGAGQLRLRRDVAQRLVRHRAHDLGAA